MILHFVCFTNHLPSQPYSMTVVKSSPQEFARPWHKGKKPQNVSNLQINAKELVESKQPQNVSNLQINAKKTYTKNNTSGNVANPQISAINV